MSGALVQVTTRLRANVFQVEGGVVTLPPTEDYGSYDDSQVIIRGDLHYVYFFLLFDETVQSPIICVQMARNGYGAFVVSYGRLR